MVDDPSRRSLPATLLSAACVFFTVEAHADIVGDCVAYSEQGQAARKAGALTNARGKLSACSQMACPRIVRLACLGWLQEVDAILPSVVLAAVDPSGRDVAGATLALDGIAVPAGRATDLDPGPHEVAASAPGYGAVTSKLLAREGERARLIEVRLAPLARPIAESPRPPAAKPRPIPWWTWGAGGLALGAFGAAAIFGLSGRADAADLRSTCAPTCAIDARDDVRTKYLVADVSLVVGTVFAGIAVASFFLTRSGEPARARAAAR